MARLPLTQSQGRAQGENSQLLNTQGIDVAAAGRQQALQGVEQAGQALSEVGIEFAKIAKKKQQAVDLKSEMGIQNDYKMAISDIAKHQSENPPGTWDEFARDRLHKSFADSNKYEMTENNREMVIGGIYGSGTGDKRVYGQVDTDIAKVHIDTVKRMTDDNIIVADAGLYQAITTSNDPAKIAEANRVYNEAHKYESPDVRDVKRKKLELNASIQSVQNQVASEKQLFMAGKIPNLDKARDIVQSSTIISEEEKQASLQNITSYEETKQKRDERDKYNWGVQQTAKASDILNGNVKDPIDGSVKSLTYDDIETMFPGTNKDAVKKRTDWHAIIDGSNAKNLATEVKGNGAIKVLNAFQKLNTGELTTQEVYDIVLKERYVVKHIDDSTFKWATQRLMNPYPEYLDKLVNNELVTRASINATKNSYPLWGTTDKQEAVSAKDVGDAQIQLFRYIDTVLEKDPKHLFKQSEIHEMKAELDTNIKTFSFKAEPSTETEFYKTMADLKSTNEDTAKQYYEKWKNKW